MPNKKQCSVKVYGDRCDSWTCQKPATIYYHGLWYCKIHDPAYKRQKDVDRQAKYDAEWDAKMERAVLQQARFDATAGLTLDELKQVTPDLIRKALEGKNAKGI